MSGFVKLLWNVLVIAALGWGGWYGYTHWVSSSSDTGSARPAAAFNCRQALARLADDYACRDSASCDMPAEELAAMKEREAAIEQHCN